MKAIRIHGRGGPDRLVYEGAPQPHPGQGEVVVRVKATTVIATELRWPETYQARAGSERSLPIPGHDLAGEVVEIGAGITEIAAGAEVYALTAFDRDGAEAEYTLALPGELAPRPRTLDDVQAAAVPLSALTAWQAFFEYASLAAGQTVLIHGAAGGVGVFAVQLARFAGAQVIGTASARNRAFLRELGVNETIDYATTRFEEVVHKVDFVLDTVGGDTLQRSWQVIKPGGTLVSVVSPRPSLEEAKAHGVRLVWFIVTPNRDQLSRIGELIDTGRMRAVVETVLPLSETRQAYEQASKRHTRGKIVLRVD